MFKDVELSRDVMASFRVSPQARAASSSDIELSVHVLTQGYWPTYPPVEVILPGDILELQKQFSSYYMSKHNGRRLQWHPYLGHCTLKANFPLGRKELAVSLLQTIVLLPFNDSDDISYQDILKVCPAASPSEPTCRPSLARAQAVCSPACIATPPAPPAPGDWRGGKRAEGDAAVARVRKGARLAQGAQGEGSRRHRRLLFRVWV